MKKCLLFALAAGLAFPIAGFAQGTLKIGTVDMNRAFKEYSKTKDSEKKINDAKLTGREHASGVLPTRGINRSPGPS